MRIIHVEDYFFPRAGYQINLLSKYMARKGHEVHIITSKPKPKNTDLNAFFSANYAKEDAVFEKNHNVKIYRYNSLFEYSGRLWISVNLTKKIIGLNPDVIFAHGNDTLTSMRITLRYKKLKTPLVLDSHMLRMASKNKFASLFRFFYRVFITPSIIKNKIPVIRTQESNYVNNDLKIPENLTPHISFGSDVQLFSIDNKKKHEFRARNKIADDVKILVYAGKMIQDKGVDLLLNALEKVSDEKLVLLLVGNIPNSAYGELLKKLIENLNITTLRYPTQSYENLAYYFKISDFAVFPKQSSLTFFEAQSAGLPVILEDNAINKKRIHNENGRLFERESTEDLQRAISYYIDLSKEQLLTMSEKIRKHIVENYDYSLITDEYLNIMEKLIECEGKYEN